MTVVVYKDGVMAADSQAFSGGMRFPIMHRKITCACVGLIGTAGRQSDGRLVHQWALAGMPDEKPRLSDDKDDPLQVLWAKPNGTLWWSDERLTFVEIPTPGSIGEPTATTFAEACMHAGKSADEAVRLAIQHCVWVGGEVQVERLHPTLAVAAE